MDLKAIVISRLLKLATVASDLSLGDILYEILRKTNMPKRPDDIDTSWLTDIQDNDFFKAIEKVINEEINDIEKGI